MVLGNGIGTFQFHSFFFCLIILESELYIKLFLIMEFYNMAWQSMYPGQCTLLILPDWGLALLCVPWAPCDSPSKVPPLFLSLVTAFFLVCFHQATWTFWPFLHSWMTWWCFSGFMCQTVTEHLGIRTFSAVGAGPDITTHSLPHGTPFPLRHWDTPCSPRHSRFLSWNQLSGVFFSWPIGLHKDPQRVLDVKAALFLLWLC